MISFDVSGLESNARTVDRLARLELRSRRTGHELVLRNAAPDLLDLLAFIGIDEVLRVEPRGQSEQREELLGVEEERQLGDPPA
jgi:hypothetical protein